MTIASSGRQQQSVSLDFYRAGEITVPSASAFDSTSHLSWGDISISEDRLVVRIFLKRSKTDQYGKGKEVFLGAMKDDICPVEARRGASPGAFFRSECVGTADKSSVCG